MEKFQETYEKWAELNSQMYKDSLEYLKTTLAKLPNQSIEIDEDFPTSCSYNGGAHPEYASNCFNMVHSVYIKNGNVLLDTEDATDYDIGEISCFEVYCIANAVEQTIKKNWDIEE